MNGRNLVKYRRDNCIPQDSLAEKLQVSRSTLSRWERNKTSPQGADFERVRSIIGEEYMVDEDLNEITTTDMKVSDISDKIDNLIYEVSKIGEKQDYNRKNIEEFLNDDRTDISYEDLKQLNIELSKKLDDYQTKNSVDRELLRQKKIRNIILLVAAILIVGLVAFFVWYLINFGLDPDTFYEIQGPIVEY